LLRQRRQISKNALNGACTFDKLKIREGVVPLLKGRVMLRFIASASLVTALLASSQAFAQWSPVSGSPNDIRNTNTSRVGINMNPWRTARLQVFGSTGEGIYGETTATGSETSAVFGWAVSTTGNNYGVSGRVESVTAGAAGVFAHSAATTGNGIGLRARADSPNGWAIYAVGTSSRSAFEGRVGIGTSGPTASLHVFGTARLENLTTAAPAGTARFVAMDSTGNLLSAPHAAIRGTVELLPNTNGTGLTYQLNVPNNVGTLWVKLWGGGGGGSSAFGGGSGAYVEVPIAVTPGEQLFVDVGGGGTVGSANISGGNGGATRIRRGSTVLAEAGGGGGGIFPNFVGPVTSWNGLGGTFLALPADGIAAQGLTGDPLFFAPTRYDSNRQWSRTVISFSSGTVLVPADLKHGYGGGSNLAGAPGLATLTY
jgi:hypothetical protein